MKKLYHKKKKAAVLYDQELLAEIYDTYQRPIYRYIYRQTGDVETARDLTADVFHRLLQAVQRGMGPNRDVKAWLYRCAHNIIVDYYRRQQFRRHVSLDEEQAVGELSTVQTAEKSIMISSIRKELAALTPDQRQVLSLRYLDGLSINEAAAIMNKSTGAVKSLQHRALKNLTRQLQPEKSPQSTIKEKGMDPNGSIPKRKKSLSPAS